jgi:hypothetical protein
MMQGKTKTTMKPSRTHRIRRCCIAALFAVLTASPGPLAQETTEDGAPDAPDSAAQSVAQPEPKPQMLIAKPEVNPMLPRPRPDPDGVAGTPEATAPAPQGSPPAGGIETEEVVTGAVPDGEETREDEACLWRLRALGVAVAPQPPIETAKGCRIAAPLAVSELSPEIFVDPEVMLTCPAAEAVTRWMQDVVVPAAQEYLEASPTGLLHSSSHACSGTGTGAGSAGHSAGETIDVTGFLFAERGALPIQVSRDEKSAKAARERAFLRTVRDGACRYFADVLGPEEDSNHPGRMHLGNALPEGASRDCP